MNEPAGSTVMRDSSGHGRHGAIRPGAAAAGLTLNGSHYKWSVRCPSCPPTALARVVQVRDSAALDIPDPSVRWTLAFRFRTGKGNSNVMQKGQATSAGGQIKIENPRGLMSCVFKGANGSYVSIRGTTPLHDRTWHTVRCVHTATRVSQYVDGRLVVARRFRTGPINNAKPFVIGGKRDCNQTSVSCDYYRGRIAWVRITRG
jgi:hypothetical protein